MAATPKPRLTHCALFVEDIGKMEDFYTDVLGMTVTDRGPFPSPDVKADMVFLSNDPKEHHEFVLVTGKPDSDTFNLAQQMSFVVDSLDEVRVIHERAQKWASKDLRAKTHGNAWSVYFQDPEGNTIEVYTYTPWYVPQPHSYPIDISLSNEEIYALTEEHCRADPGFMMASEREAQMAQAMGLTH